MMNNEEFDRKMEFIINQQAQFDANIQQLQEGHKELQEAQKATEEKLGRLTNSLTELTRLTQEGFKRTLEFFNNTDAKINALINAQIRTDEVLHRHLKEDRNGSKS